MNDAQLILLKRLRGRTAPMMFDALRAFAECVDFGSFSKQPVGWPIHAAFITPDAIRITTVDRDCALR